MNPIIISTCALIVSIVGFVFSFWSYWNNLKLKLAQRKTDALALFCDAEISLGQIDSAIHDAIARWKEGPAEYHIRLLALRDKNKDMEGKLRTARSQFDDESRCRTGVERQLALLESIIATNTDVQKRARFVVDELEKLLPNRYAAGGTVGVPPF